MNSSKTLITTIFFILLVSLCTFSSVKAEDQKVCKDISAPEVNNMLFHGHALVVHVMSSFEYDIQHIEKSINIPVNKLIQQQDKLPKDKNFPVIFYCMGQR